MDQKKAEAKTEVKAKKELDPKKVAANEAKKKARKEARDLIIKALADERTTKFIAGLGKDFEKLRSAIQLFIGLGVKKAASGVVRSVNNDIRAAFLEAHKAGKGLTEMDIFKMFKIGRPEMVTKIRILVLTPNPADRVWVKFDEASETYFVAGLGENPPKGWEGYIPSAKKEL